MGEEEFRLPQSSYEELAKIIVGYGRFEAEVSPSDVGRVMALHETIVSRNNAFLVAIGVVAGGKRKAMTDVGRGLARALEHQMPEEITRHWQAVISNVKFFKNLIAAVRIRRGMDAATLQAHVAYSAGQKKSPGVMAGAAAVVEIMEAAGAIHEEGGKLVAADEPFGATTITPESGQVTIQGHAPNVVITPAAVTSPSGLPATASGIGIQLQIQIQCTPADLETLGEKLRVLIDQVSRPRNPAGE